jgi:acetyltransferase-like isoleucine patch superfamily enzyme
MIKSKMKFVIKKYFPLDSLRHWILLGFYHNPVKFLWALIASVLATYQLTGKVFPICVRISSGQSLRVRRARCAQISIKGIIYVTGWGAEDFKSSITCSDGSRFILLGDFIIGPNVHITVAKDAVLELGGKQYSSGSGITCNSRILVHKCIKIGFDTIIAWGVSILDSDSHYKNWDNSDEAIYIGNHVWIAHDVSIFKGSIIPSGCIVGSKSLVTKANFAENTLIAGVPATERRTNVKWRR